MLCTRLTGKRYQDLIAFLPRENGHPTVRLKFEGQAIVEVRSGGVNFAGNYVDDGGRSRDILCRITRKALEVLCDLPNPSADDVLAAYVRESDRINQLAAVQFSAGIGSPTIEVSDVPPDWLKDTKAA